MTEGEAWARGLLCELRADRYRPRAWLRFFAASFVRAHTTRRQRQREHQQVLVVGAVGLTGWSAVFFVRPWLALVGALWWLLVIAMFDWHLGMLEDEHGRPLPRLGLPNLLSLARATVVPALLVASPALLAALLIPAGISDGIDGPFARRRGEETRLGAWLDGGVDTLVLSAAAVGAARHGLLPWWAAAFVLGRQTLPWLAVSLAYFVRATPPSRAGVVSGKAPGMVLFTGLVLSVLGVSAGELLVALGAAGGLTTFGATLVRARHSRDLISPAPTGTIRA